MSLQESVVKACISNLDHNELCKYLEEISFSKGDLGELCGHIRRCSELICKYPSPHFTECRSDFFCELRALVSKHLGSDAAGELDSVVRLIEFIERGYRKIMQSLAKCSISQQPASTRVSASIALACSQYHQLAMSHEQYLSNAKEVTLPSGIELIDEHGHAYSPDAILEGLSEVVAMTVIMEAYKNDWFSNDMVILPELSPVTDSVCQEAQSMQKYALCWRQWQRVENRRRFLGGHFQQVSKGQFPAGVSEEITSIINYVPEQDERRVREAYDSVANTRLKDRLVQTFVELELETNVSEQGVGIANGARLPSEQYVSTEEVHANMSLSDLLGYSTVSDEELPGGIRLVEWIRGFIVLKELAKIQTSQQNKSEQNYAILLSETELIETLSACGLENERARIFIERTSLYRFSPDLFDSPLIQVGHSKYLLFAPAILHLNVIVALMSNLSRRGEQLSRKGKAFEHFIRDGFRKRGMDVFSINVRRNGNQYECDAIVPWQRYLFLFECKNRSLSGNHPAQTYYFDLQVQSHARQARRLAEALNRYPDIVEKELGAKYVGMEIIPCVLHSLPYSRAGDLDGVFFLDTSSIFRFFDNPYFNIKVHHRPKKQKKITHRVRVRRIWNGDRPSPEDFLEYLRNPLQLELSIKHLDYTHVSFVISPSEMVMAQELVRAQMNPRSMCEALGADAGVVLGEMEKALKN